MKTIKTNLSYLKYLFWLGPALVVAGLTIGFVTGNWRPLPPVLIAAGIICMGLGLTFAESQAGDLQPGFWNRRSTQVGANTLVATTAVLVILGLVNFLGVQHTARIDLTENQLFTLAPQTQQVVKNLKQPIKIWVFDGQQNPQDRALLENFQRQGGDKLSFEYVDPQARPGLAQQFELKNIGDVYLEVPPGRRRQFVQTVGEQERLSEAKLANSLVQVTSDQLAKAYFLQGHGERPLEEGRKSFSQAVKALGNGSFTTTPLNLAQQVTVPQDAAVVVVAGPERPLLEGEVKSLTDYLNQGGSLLVLVEPNTNAGMDSLLKGWGVTLDSRTIIDASGNGRLVGLGPADPLVTQYGEHPITKDFRNGISFYPLARPVEISPVTGVNATPILLTDPRSWAESDLKSQPLEFDPAKDKQGPLAIGVALSKDLTPAPTPSPSPSPQASPSPTPSPSAEKKEARLVVFGDTDFASDGLFEQQLNGDVFLNSVKWLGQQDQQVLSIRPKEAKNRRINLSPEQANLIAVSALGLLPLLGFGTATFVWWRRR